MIGNIEQGWQHVLSREFKQPYYLALADFVKQAYESQTIYPAADQIFAAFNACPWADIKVVILGQDPYHGIGHGAGQANGLCFSVNEGLPIPPSLRNIYKELYQDLGILPSQSGNLTPWAQQGVLLLNTTLTVQAGQAGSHQGHGWETFTDAVIRAIADQHQPVVFMLWGNYARRKADMIDGQRHLILQSAHPSPLSAHQGFLGNKHFSQCNAWLVQQSNSPINWEIDHSPTQRGLFA